MQRYLLLAAMVLLPSTACRHEAKTNIRDTEGRRFEARCNQTGCSVHRMSAASVSPQKTAAKLRAAGRLVGVCDVRPHGKVEQTSDCRALTCSSDDDCPSLNGLPKGHCVNGLCIEPENPISVEDAILLCLAGTGLGRSAPKQVERYALALNCGSPCQIPAPCRQP